MRLLIGTHKSAKAKLALTLLAAVAALGSAALAAVYAAKAKDFSLSTTPQSRSLSAGQAATYAVKVKRQKGFTAPVTLGVKNLPGGTTATFNSPASCRTSRGARCPKNKPNVLGARVSTATLTLKTAAGTPVGTAKPTITAKGGGKSHTTTVSLVVQGVTSIGSPGSPSSPPQSPSTTSSSAPPAPTFALAPSPASRNVVVSDSTTFTIGVDRSGGFTGPVSLGVSGLPSGTTATFAPASTVSGDSATMTVDTADTTPAGTSTLTVTATGSGTATRTATVTLVVAPKVDIGLSGDLGSISPGQTKPLDLQLHNPYDFDVQLNHVGVGLATTAPGCAAAENFQVTQIPADQFPITLAANATTTLSALGKTEPQVAMVNDPNRNQDACKGAALQLTYTGDATK